MCIAPTMMQVSLIMISTFLNSMRCQKYISEILLAENLSWLAIKRINKCHKLFGRITGRAYMIYPGDSRQSCER